MSLDQNDINCIERMVYKNSDDIAVSIARSFERLEDRVDAVESRLASQLYDLEERLETSPKQE